MYKDSEPHLEASMTALAALSETEVKTSVASKGVGMGTRDSNTYNIRPSTHSHAAPYHAGPWDAATSHVRGGLYWAALAPHPTALNEGSPTLGNTKRLHMYPV